MPRPMIGCKDAAEWVRKQQVIDVDIKERVINRMEYEFVKAQERSIDGSLER